MFIKTHLAITAAFILIFVQHVSHQLIFVAVALAATFIPDIDNAFSTLGKYKAFRFLQFFVKHRGAIHSFTVCILLSLLLAVFWPVASLPFFLGYSLHLFADSLTQDGIAPFWPYRKRSMWCLRTGGMVETTIFLFFILLDIALAFILFF